MVRQTAGAAGLLVALGLLLGARSAGAYEVRPGDTLWAIAHRTGVPVDRIVHDNGIADPNRITPGQHLAIAGEPAATPAPAPRAAPRTYAVRDHDTLWSISRRTGISVDALARRNHLADPNRLRVGQRLALDDPAPAAPVRAAAAGAGPAPEPVRGAAARSLVAAAAREQGVDPDFVMAVSLWESGYNQGAVSVDGAVGLMQVMPGTALWAGPALLGRPVDIRVAADNARLGAALLRRYLSVFADPKLALAAYYQGERGTRDHGVYPSSRSYVDGIWSLRNLLRAGER
jgi:N-acetylmuramoyl-L-alanine amidase